MAGAAGACRQTPCLRHPCNGVVVQAGEWDLLGEKKDGAYYVHHYPYSFIFLEKETKALKFGTLKAVNDYLAGLK